MNWLPGQFSHLETALQAARQRTPNLILHDVPAFVPTTDLRRGGASHITWAA